MGQIYRPSLDKVCDDGQYPMPPCTKVDPDIFTQHRTRRAAQRICRSCPIRNACLVSALRRDSDPGGVYGGLSEAHRAKIRRRVPQLDAVLNDCTAHPELFDGVIRAALSS